MPTGGRLPWRLADGADGERRVYLRFRDDCGNVTQEFDAAITLDRSAVIRGTARLEGQSSHADVVVSFERSDDGGQRLARRRGD